MSGVLFKIPIAPWVMRTIEKMNNAGKEDIESWSQYWYKTYQELGGNSIGSGTKGCPQHAAYGLWRLGRIKGTEIPYQNAPISSINKKYGKNAAYAVLALDILEEGKRILDSVDLWNQVKVLYRRKVRQEPAESQQGAITIAQSLFAENRIVREDTIRNQVA